ncbi:MAG: hypothetical protein U5R46_17750 [Gammaproteobacteria bacterium]|nr:hypothetical protein [Gammaproteobacteria bacterium]
MQADDRKRTDHLKPAWMPCRAGTNMVLPEWELRGQFTDYGDIEVLLDALEHLLLAILGGKGGWHFKNAPIAFSQNRS